MTVNIPGQHNVKNALGAVAVCRNLGIDFETIRTAIADFSGVYRRFEIKGEKNGIMVVDDYAHHPSEIKATLEAARNGWNKRIVAVFQPHTFTRTQRFYEDFGQSFDEADVLIVTDIYPAREKPIEGITGKLISDSAVSFGHKNVHYVDDMTKLDVEVNKLLKKGDLLITLGAGDIWKLADRLIGKNL
jgi:UDP-N-acetylmuramate--alanine ligase